MAASGIDSKPWRLALAQVAFYWPDKRRRDEDNAIASLKAAYDGLVSSGLLVDDDSKHLKREMPRFEVDPVSPRVEITVIRES